MGIEIERKFLVKDDGWQRLVTSRAHIRQGYLALGGKATIRVRVKDDGAAMLTIKSRSAKLRRLELEYPIPPADAEALLALRRGAAIEKTRHIVPYAGATWEIDVFAGENAGLVIAEVELPHENAHLELPPFIGAEVTGRTQYYNSSLVARPYRNWPAPAPART